MARSNPYHPSIKAGEDLHTRYAALRVGDAGELRETDAAGQVIVGSVNETADEGHAVGFYNTGIVNFIASAAITVGHSIVSSATKGQVSGVAANIANNVGWVALTAADAAGDTFQAVKA